MKLPKSLTTVTPFSKFIAMFLFITFPLSGFYVGMRYQQLITSVERNAMQIAPAAPTSIPVAAQLVDFTKPAYTLASSSCSKEECLFKSPGSSNEVEGFARIRGYYHTYTAADWGNNLVTCKSLLVTGGSEVLRKSFMEQIRSGNTINKIENDNLLVNIDLESVPLAARQKIEQSTMNNPIELGVIRITPEGRGVSTCFSFLDIVSVQ